jgi:hypothetical protein
MQTFGPSVHSASALHGLQVFDVLSQMGVSPSQSAFVTHSTQVPVAVHTGFLSPRAAHLLSVVLQPTQVFVATSQMGLAVPQ